VLELTLSHVAAHSFARAWRPLLSPFGRTWSSLAALARVRAVPSKLGTANASLRLARSVAASAAASPLVRPAQVKGGIG
jgi:hypothetical protein